jgi:hypothetical protein
MFGQRSKLTPEDAPVSATRRSPTLREYLRTLPKGRRSSGSADTSSLLASNRQLPSR